MLGSPTVGEGQGDAHHQRAHGGGLESTVEMFQLSWPGETMASLGRIWDVYMGYMMGYYEDGMYI